MRVVFDLDGTLVDSVEDLLAAINRVLADHHLPLSNRKENLRYAGLGVEPMFRRSIEARVPSWDEEEKQRLTDAMIDLYRKNPATLTRPFEGIEHLLESLQKDGVSMCVISNKTSNLSQQILSTLFSSIDFERIIGPDSGYPPKPNPMSLLSCREGMGMGEQMLYIGDTEIDWQTAHRSADHVYLATWGYRGRQALMAYGIEERYLIDYPMELFSIVQKKGDWK